MRKVNERQYVANMPNVCGRRAAPCASLSHLSQVANLEVWFQRASDVMRKLRAGDLDLGIVGYDMFVELGEARRCREQLVLPCALAHSRFQGDEDLVVVHDALGFGQCHLAVAVPQGWDEVSSLAELKALGWTAERPLRVVTGYTHIARDFFAAAGLEHVSLSTADGALEAAPAMGSADVILDLVSSGTTLRENNLKQIAGGRVLESQGVLVASKRALLSRPGALEVLRDMIERLEAHLRAEGQFVVTANMRGGSAEEVAVRLAAGGPLLTGLQGPTLGSIYSPQPGGAWAPGAFISATFCVPRKQIYETVKQLRLAGGSGVLVAPLTYIFDEGACAAAGAAGAAHARRRVEPPRWKKLLALLGISDPKDLPPQH